MQSTPTTPVTKTPFWKNWKVLILLFAVVAVVLSALIRVLTPAATSVPETSFMTTGFSNVKTTFSNVVFSGSYQADDKVFYVYDADQVDTSSDILPKLLSRFNLQPHPTAKNVWLGAEYSLTFDKSLNFYTLTKNVTTETAPTPKVIQLTEAVQAAQNFVTSLGIDYMIPFTNDAQYFTSVFELDESNQFKAELIQIPFAPSFDSTPLFFSNLPTYPVSVLVNSDYSVKKIDILPYFYQLGTQTEVSLISISDAVKNINTGKGAVIHAVGNTTEYIPYDTIAAGNLTSVSVEYRLDQEARKLYPFYRFSGTLTTNLNKELEAEVITPAIRTQ